MLLLIYAVYVQGTSTPTETGFVTIPIPTTATNLVQAIRDVKNVAEDKIIDVVMAQELPA